MNAKSTAHSGEIWAVLTRFRTDAMKRPSPTARRSRCRVASPSSACFPPHHHSLQHARVKMKFERSLPFSLFPSPSSLCSRAKVPSAMAVRHRAPNRHHQLHLPWLLGQWPCCTGAAVSGGACMNVQGGIQRYTATILLIVT